MTTQMATKNVAVGSSVSESANSGLTLAHKNSNHNSKILNHITPNLFEEGPNRDAAIKHFLASTEFRNNYVFKDGIQRCQIPHITLPGREEIFPTIDGIFW
jgi:hypothetical protein